MPINGLDLAVIVILLLSAILAFMRGFVHEVLSVAAWVAAVFAVIYGLPMLQPVARDMIPNTLIADIAAAVIIFLASLVVCSIMTKMMSKTIQASALNNLDRSLGFLFGLLRGIVVFGGILIVMDWFVDTDGRPDWVESAKTLPVIEVTANAMRELMPEGFMAAEDAAKEAGESAREALELKETFDKLTQPPPGSDPGADKIPDGAYEQDERRSMDRLFQTNQDDQ
jgi:membrane protein required for colicin V production